MEWTIMFQTEEEKERLKWMSLKEAVDHIVSAEHLEREEARRQLVNFIAERWPSAKYGDDPSSLRKNTTIPSSVYESLNHIKDASEEERTKPVWPYRAIAAGSTHILSANDFIHPPRSSYFIAASETIDWNASTILDEEFSARRPLLVRRADVERTWSTSIPPDDQSLPLEKEITAPAPPADTESKNQTLPHKKRGPKTGKTKALKEKLLTDLRAGTLTREILYSEKEESMAKTHNVCRDTYRKARDEALSEFKEVSNPDK